jgi:ABC-type polysaccharide/polyol phosphate export permease
MSLNCSAPTVRLPVTKTWCCRRGSISFRAVSSANPLTYQVDALRALMLKGSASACGLPLDFAVLVAFTAVLTLIAARLNPRLTS